MRAINTLSDLIDCIGGIGWVADYCMTRPPEVQRWIERGFVAPGWHLRFLAFALANGGTFDQAGLERVFGLCSEDAKTLAVALSRRG
ncbi:hypothetical protein [Hyphomicrobium sp. CS1BSMeth3]|uniref:hypothetical protein n=1 Tax=Hyphomicrobium sp. CS1BSMeth3 TaxID=1892844 RepID=UPI00093104B0|nr:hypothetical protein [Hyphomicrobium sp. CS1BSMeth3]